MHQELLRMRRRVAVGRVVGVLFLIAGIAVAAYFLAVQADEPLALRAVGTAMGIVGSVSGVLVAREFHRLSELPWHDPGVAQAKLAQRVEPLASAGTIAAIACSLAAALASRLS
jgi:drug/metabolite transporter (DMT)-like permease